MAGARDLMTERMVNGFRNAVPHSRKNRFLRADEDLRDIFALLKLDAPSRTGEVDRLFDKVRGSQV